MRWLFFVHNPLGLPALAEVFDAAVRRGGIEAWFTSAPQIDLSRTRGGDVELFQEHALAPEEAHRRAWDLVLATDNQKGESVPAGRRVRLAHGAAFGTHGYGIHSLSRCDLYLATSPAHRRFLEANRPRKGRSAAVEVGGHPRYDRGVRCRIGRNRILEALGLPPDRPTVVIGSHWSRHTNVRTFGASLARAVLDAVPEANVVQTGHPNIWDRVQYDIGGSNPGLLQRAAARVRRALFPFDYERLFRDLAVLERRFPRFRVVRSDWGFDVLPAADLLVGDWSSVTVEFAGLDRPIAYFDSPHLRFLDADVQRAFRDASHPFRTLDEAAASVREGLAAPEARKEARRALFEMSIANPGSSGERIVDVLVQDVSDRRAPLAATRSTPERR